MSLAVGAICWTVYILIAVFVWPNADWSGKALLGWLFLVGAAVSAFVLAGRSNLYLIADATHIRFGKRVISRSQVSEITSGPTVTSTTQFWLGVLMMAISQDFTPRVYLRTADGRSLLEIPDIYGSGQLAKLAAYLGIPFVDSHRAPRSSS